MLSNKKQVMRGQRRDPSLRLFLFLALINYIIF